MAALKRSPGPAAEQAFTLGLTIAITVAVTGLGVLLWADVLTVLDLVVVSVLGLPPLFVIASCLLSVWLGYNEDAADIALS